MTTIFNAVAQLHAYFDNYYYEEPKMSALREMSKTPTTFRNIDHLLVVVNDYIITQENIGISSTAIDEDV